MTSCSDVCDVSDALLLVGCHSSMKSTFSMFLNTWSECTGCHRSNSRRLQWRSNTLQNNTRSCAEHYCVAFFSVRCGNKMPYVFNMTISKIVISWKFLPIQFCAMQYRLPNNSVLKNGLRVERSWEYLYYIKLLCILPLLDTKMFVGRNTEIYMDIMWLWLVEKVCCSLSELIWIATSPADDSGHRTMCMSSHVAEKSPGNRNEMVSMASAHVQFMITDLKRFWSCFDVASVVRELQPKRWFRDNIMAFFVLESSQNLHERQGMVYCETLFH